MESLKEKIRVTGTVIDNRILKVDSFLNQQLDMALIMDLSYDVKYMF